MPKKKITKKSVAKGRKTAKKQSVEQDTVSTSQLMVVLEDMNGKFDMMTESQDVLVEDVRRINHRLDSLEGKVDNLQMDMTEVKFKLDRKVSYEDFEKLEKRVIQLEKTAMKSR